MKLSAVPPAKARMRRLSEEEIELWLDVTKTVTRRPGSRLPELKLSAQPAGQEPGKNDPPAEDTLAGRRPAATGREPKPIAALAPLERRLRQRLARGKEAPDAVIDLHGLRRHEAFVALHQFLTRAQLDGARLVLVVTGKGGRSAGESEEAGVLRRSVPLWLHAPDYRSIVIGFEEASRPHGGTGALYVRIRRRDPARR